VRCKRGREERGGVRYMYLLDGLTTITTTITTATNTAIPPKISTIMITVFL